MRRFAARLVAALPRRRRRSPAGDIRLGTPAAPTAADLALEARFALYIDWLTSEGYGFRALGPEAPDLAPSAVYLRYDTVPEGLATARRLAALHERHQVPATFALPWDLIRDVASRVADAAEMRKFDPNFVRFGLHCAPVENFLCRHRFAGDTRRQADFLASPGLAAFLDALTEERAAEIRAGAVEQLRTESDAFAAAFGRWPTVAGRSGVWSAAFARERARRPDRARLDDVFHPVRFLASLDLEAFGFGPEAAALPGDNKMGPHIIFGGGSVETVRRDHHQRVWSGGGFVAIFPPASWERDSFDCLTIPPCFPGSPPAAGPPASAILTNLEDLVPFGRRCDRLDCQALAEAACKRAGPRLEPLFCRFVEWLTSEGYVFADLEHGPPLFAERRVYLRYDVHIQDLLPAYALAGMHQRLAIPGSFQLNWRFSLAEEQLEPFFLKFREFDPRFVQVGLHCAPPATWFTRERCGGDLTLAERTVNEPEFAEYARGLLAAYQQRGDMAEELAQVRAGTDAVMTELAESFRAALGNWQTVSGHGNFLAAAFARLRAREPALAPLQDYFNAVAYLRRFGVARFGLAHELTVFPNDRRDLPCVILEGGDQALRRRYFHGRVDAGLGFLCLFHPATLTTDNLAAIVPAPT